jgi:hypothetical protein
MRKGANPELQEGGEGVWPKQKAGLECADEAALKREVEMGRPKGPYAKQAGTCRYKDLVEYNSPSQNGRRPATVTNFDIEGAIQIDIKLWAWITVKTQSARVTPRAARDKSPPPRPEAKRGRTNQGQGKDKERPEGGGV